MAVNVFISHTTSDKSVAREIGASLVALDVGVWFDEWEIKLGDSIPEQIQLGLERSTHVVVLWSQAAANSKWVQRELNSSIARAISYPSVRVLPVLLDDTVLPPLLADIKHVRWRGLGDEAWAELAAGLTGTQPPQNLRRAVVQVYQSLIWQENAGPFGLVACPECGGDRLRHWDQTSPRDDLYHFVRCEECRWSDWTR